MTFKTMLAGKADEASLRFPAMGSPKLDGVRCHVIDGVAVSRNLLPFRNPEIQRMFGRIEFNGLDGELMVGDPTHPEAFRATGVLNSHGGDCSEVKLFVFDDFSERHESFVNRLTRAHRRIEGVKHFAPVDHVFIHTLDQLADYEAECLARGYEGVMLRAPHGPYKYGRATTREGWLMKLKRFMDGEAIIEGVEELMHNANEKTLVKNGKAHRNSQKAGKIGRNMLGAYTVRDMLTNVKFSVGSGFTEAERMDLWDGANLNIGRIIKYRYFPTGSKDKPRFPTFLGFRDPIDL